MSAFNAVSCPEGTCATCDILQRADEEREAWYARLRARIADAPRTCEGIAAHPWTPENVQTRPNGTAYCRACANARRPKSDRGKQR